MQAEEDQRHQHGIREKKASVTMSPANILAYRRTVSESRRARCETISINSISGLRTQIGPRNCLT